MRWSPWPPLAVLLTLVSVTHAQTHITVRGSNAAIRMLSHSAPSAAPAPEEATRHPDAKDDVVETDEKGDPANERKGEEKEEAAGEEKEEAPKEEAKQNETQMDDAKGAERQGKTNSDSKAAGKEAKLRGGNATNATNTTNAAVRRRKHKTKERESRRRFTTPKPSIQDQLHVAAADRTLASGNRTSKKAKRSMTDADRVQAEAKLVIANVTGNQKLAKEADTEIKTAKKQMRIAKLEHIESREAHRAARYEHREVKKEFSGSNPREVLCISVVALSALFSGHS